MAIHRLIFTATLPQGDPDLGAEIDVRVTCDYLPAARFGLWPRNPTNHDRITFIDATPTHGPFCGAFADLEQAWLDDLVSQWLESDAGYDAVVEAFSGTTIAGEI
jgi:hypothetical protein